MKRIRLLSCILAALILLSAVPMTGAAQDTSLAVGEMANDAAENESDSAKLEGVIDYATYLQTHGKRPEKKSNIEAIKLADPAKDKTDRFVMSFEVKEEGYYTLSFNYKYIVSGNKNTTYDILIDDELPYREAASMTLSRMWTNEDEIKTDTNGDDINPKQIEAQIWRSLTVYDKQGYVAEKDENGAEKEYEDKPLAFYLTAGKHTLTLQSDFTMKVKEQDKEVEKKFTDIVDVKEAALTYDQPLRTYDEYLAAHASKVYDGAENIVVQGESALNKSEMYLIAQNDITSPQTVPYHASKIKLNTFGGANWKLNGETVEWLVDVEQSGLYKLSIRYRQNYYDGVSAHRRLYVNGEVPYKEANALEFPYDNVWQTFTLQSEAGEDLYVYLEAGKQNSIALQVVLGSSAKIADELQNLVREMNTIYREIIMITGSSPDDYRDYNIEKQIPTILTDLASIKTSLESVSAEIGRQYGEDSSLIAKINNITRQLDLMLKKPAQITKSDRLGAFKGNISTVGSWISMFREQPLEIDRMEFYGDNGAAPRAKATFLEDMKHGFDRFIASFTEDYSSMGMSLDGTSTSVNVWIQAGRDQANVLKQLITSSFTPKTGVGVELELVTGAIIEATLAGKGPDIALSRPVTDPVNFAMRNALYDLSTFEDYEEVTKYFVDGAMIPFEYKGGVYALPETMSYQMMFVRTDIMQDLNLKLPATWDELLTEVYPIVSRNNMEIGIGNMNQIAAMNASNIFTNLLYQMGGQIYNDELTATALDTQVAYQAFNRSVELYADYLFPQEYDAMSRFRTGEMPILLADYTMYNVFSISLPELDGMWEMHPIPGELQEDGTINNSQAATEVASVMFKDIEDPEAGWKFLKWWVGEETQAEFGTRIEAILGSGGRYATANVNAMSKLPWKDEQLASLKEQMNSLVFVEQLPGSYFTSRAINSAFMTSVLNSENPTEQLLYWSEQINLELTRKIEEFSD